MLNKKNKEAIIQIILLINIACLLIYAIISNKITYFVHPRFFKGIWISIVVLFLFAICLISKIGEARHNVNIRHYIIFLIPLTSALLSPGSGINGNEMTVSTNFSSSVDNQGTQVTKASNTIDSNGNINTVSTENNSNINNIYTPVISVYHKTTKNTISEDDTKDYSEKFEKYEDNGVIVINDDMFSEWYFDLYNYPDSFKGKKFQYLAQVYSLDDSEPNQFVAGRYFMICCIADLEGYGIICESDKRSELKNNDWITVTGTIDEYNYKGDTVPILKDVTITKAEAPSIEYVYYNYQ